MSLCVLMQGEYTLTGCANITETPCTLPQALLKSPSTHLPAVCLHSVSPSVLSATRFPDDVFVNGTALTVMMWTRLDFIAHNHVSVCGMCATRLC